MYKRQTESAVWADGRYFVQAEKEIAGTEIQLMRMGEPGVPTAEDYCGKVLPEHGVLGLCGLTASCGLVRGVQKELDAKKGTIKMCIRDRSYMLPWRADTQAICSSLMWSNPTVLLPSRA